MFEITKVAVESLGRRLRQAEYKAKGREKRQFCLRAKIFRELDRFLDSRYGAVLPDDDAGRDDLELAFAYLPTPEARLEYASARAPWLVREEAVSLAANPPRWLKARALGERLGLTDAERTALRITTIRPIDVTDEDLAERARAKMRMRKALKRQRERSGKPQAISHTKPWEAEGISRRTWYRRQQADAAGPKRGTKSVPPSSLSLTRDTICATTPTAHAAREPAPMTPASAAPPKKQESIRAKAPTPRLKTDTARAESLILLPSHVDAAIKIIQNGKWNISHNRAAVQRLLERKWPRWVRSAIDFGNRYYGSFNPWRDFTWEASLRGYLDAETQRIDLYRHRRRQWKQRVAA